MHTPTWLDRNEYPFENRYLNIGKHELHYIDEGQGETILLIHGVPDWSFGWRKVIKKLSSNYRCIAIDNLGFGLSDKTIDTDLSIAGHAKRLSQFITQLKLSNFHLVVHDFGGPIGLSYAVDNAENIKSITAFNTWAFPLNGIEHFERGAKVVNTWLGKFLYLQCNFSVRFMLKNSYADKKFLPPHVYEHYLKAQQERNARIATYTLAKELMGAKTQLEYVWANRHKLQHIPALVTWGLKDKFVPADLLQSKVASFFGNAILQQIPNAGHFVQEEAAEELSKAIIGLIHKISGQPN